MRRWNVLGICMLLGSGCSDKAEPKKVDPKLDAGPSEDAGPEPQFATLDRLSVNQGFLRDTSGRALILRGVNARVEGVFDVTFDDGRTPVEEVPELTDADCKRMAELGFSLLRLPISWSGIEPERDQFNEAYLKRVDAAVACAREHGVYVLVDSHQDAYSKEIGEDGAPLWAIVPAPEMLLEGPLTSEELFRRRSSKAALDASASFFAEGDPNGLQAEYIAMLEHVAQRYADEPSVMGFDLYNEPVTVQDLLASFNERAGQAVSKAAPELVVVFEPDALWSRRGRLAADVLEPYPVANAIYAPHTYDVALDLTPREGLQTVFESAAKEAKAFGVPFMIGEFGASPSSADYFEAHYDLQDEFLVSSALWLWKEGNQDSWGIHDNVDGVWRERREMVTLVSRPHAQRIAGTPSAMRFEDTTLTFAYDDALDTPNQVFIPERFVVDSVRCDSTKVTPQIVGTRVYITCKPASSHTVEIKLSAK